VCVSRLDRDTLIEEEEEEEDLFNRLSISRGYYEVRTTRRRADPARFFPAARLP
jgi:hypothetical protein